MDNNVTAIFVTYNSAQVIAEALLSLASSPQVARVVVVDNASVDSTLKEVARACPTAQVIANTENRGFGVANNQGLATVTTPYALLVNPDVVFKADTLAELLAAAERYPNAALLAPTLFSSDGSYFLSHKLNLFARETQKAERIQPEGDICADNLSGAVFLLRMEAVRKTGAFDEKIFLYYEDDDLCLKLRAAGYSAVLVHAAQVTHKGNVSTTPSPGLETLRQAHLLWSRAYMEEKYVSKAAARLLALKGIPVHVLKWLLYTVMNHPRKREMYKGRVLGAMCYLRGKQPKRPGDKR